ncbi:NYN domain-containing protein [Roseiflexus sp. RS-1]|uniref:NYN domain-containing protein n=1 Tax=Roseiflexus sp. (strain RS-1) TaxID=357808 RepID=UPI0002E0CA9C|nr:NYN domain-containing protein [Roseiflexus sp. RS-1]
MATDNPRLDVAVFIDFENVYVSVRDKLDVNPNFEIIMDRVADLGRVVIARAYADWYRYPRVTSALYANGIEPMYVPTYYYDRDLGRTGRAIKNSVDMNLCIDAMKTLYTNPNIAKFVLATGDRDFIPLVNAIRQHGKEVIIIGVGGAASGHLAQSADEFIFYEQLLGKKPQPLQADVPRIRTVERGRDMFEVEEPAPAPRQRAEPQPAERAQSPAQPPAPEPAREEPDIYDMLVQAVHLARERGYVCSFGSLKLVMKELMGGEFKESKYRDSNGKPFAKFKDFALEAERRGKVQVFTSGAIVEVFLPGEDPYKLSQFAQDLKEEPPVSTPETPINVDAHIDGRPVSTSRRRRRRRGSATRPSAAETSAVLSQSVELTGDVEDELITEALHEAANGQNASSDEVFEELLDRLEAERERQEALASFDMLAPDTSPTFDELPDLEEEPERDLRLEAPDLADQMIIVDTPVEPPEPFESVEPPVGDTVARSAEVRPFTEAEWQMLRSVVAAAGRPLTFAQIHDLLREARNNAGIFRTNEELRSLIKQAINSGMLRRSGKGARIVYHLAPQEPPEHTEQPSDAAAATDPLSEVSVVAYAVETGFVFVPEGEASGFAAAPAEAMAATGAEEERASTSEGVPGEAMVDASGFAAAPAEAMAATGAEEEHASTSEGVPGEAMVDASGFAAAPAEAMAATGAEEEAHATGSAEAPVTTIAESAVTAQETETGESAPIVATVEEQPKPRRRRAPRVKAETDEVSANVQTDVSAADVATESSPRRSRRKTATEAADATPRAPRRRKAVEKQDREVTEDTSVT